MFGDESELLFWTIALHYLRAEKAEPMSKCISHSSSQPDTSDLFIPSTPARETQDLVRFDDRDPSEVSWAAIKDQPLETCFDTLIDSATFQVRAYSADYLNLSQLF